MARPLQKTYDPTHPYVVRKHDMPDGSIEWQIWDERPDTFGLVCLCPEEHGMIHDEDRGAAQRHANTIVRALNLMNGGLP